MQTRGLVIRIDNKFLGLLHDSKDSAATSKGGIQEREKNIKYHEKIGGREELNLTAGKCALKIFFGNFWCVLQYTYKRDEIKIGKTLLKVSSLTKIKHTL